MSHYWKKCPHCGRVVENGYGSPSMTLGNPYRICRYCLGRYRDSSVIEWESASVFRKILFYIGNVRLFGSLFVSFLGYVFLDCFTNLETWIIILLSIIFFALLFTACLLFARHEVRVYLGIAEPLKLKKEKTSDSMQKKSRKEYNAIISKRIAAMISLLLCAALYLSFLFAFSTKRDTYICYTTKTGECFHTATCRYASKTAYETTVYEACKKYKPCNYCNPCVKQYETTITVRNYVIPLIISVPASITVYVLLTIGKKKPESTG